MRWKTFLAVVAVALAALSCAAGRKDGSRPSAGADGTAAQCPYCKAVLRW